MTMGHRISHLQFRSLNLRFVTIILLELIALLKSIKVLMMTARKHGHQLAQRLGWAALAYHKQKGAAPDPGPCKHCLQNDGKHDEWLGVRVGTWNVVSMSGRSA